MLIKILMIINVNKYINIQQIITELIIKLKIKTLTCSYILEIYILSKV